MRTRVYDVAQPCPSCGATLDAVTDPLGRSTPKPGDLTVCFECGTALVFDKPPRFHAITDEELARLSDEEADELMMAQRVAKSGRRG